jgi:ribosome-binding factor A
MSRRQERVRELIRDELSAVIQHEMHDPRLGGLISITDVSISPDLKFARVYLSVLGDEEEQRDALKAARSAAGFLRRTLGSRTTLRYVPELHFEADRSIERGDRVLRILKEVSAEEAEGGAADEQ